jgi:uncharacterized membrane protein YkvI
MALAVFVTTYFGLRRLVEVIGWLGPLLIVLIIVIAATALLQNAGGITRGAAIASALETPRAAPNWWMAGLVYIALCTAGLGAFLPPLGAAHPDRRQLAWAGILGPLAFTATLALCVLALLGSMPEIATRMIPMLELAQRAAPALAVAFSWIMLAAIFTTAVPLLWIASVRLAVDGSPRYRVVAAALGSAGLAISVALPFDRFVNLLYPTIGWSAMLMIAFIVAKQIRSGSIDG